MWYKCIFSIMLAGFLISSNIAIGQSKFAFSASVSPFYGHSSVTVVLPDDFAGTPGFPTTKIKSSPKGYTVGLNGRYSFSKNWSASTGLWFSEFRSKSANSKGRSRHSSIPLLVNFQVSDKKLSPYLSAGALWNFRTSSRITSPDFGTINFKSGGSRSKIAPQIGAGAIYHFSPNLSLIAQPTFTYFIPPSGYSSRAHQFGLNVQVMFGF